MVLLLSLLAVSVAATEAAKWVDPPPRYVCPDRPLYPCVCIRGGDDGLRLECSNTNLASLALGLRQVRSLIHTLRISNCNIERLYGNVFRSLSVRKLYVEDTPVKDISDGTFDELMADSMEELHLTNSWLTRVPPSLKNLTNLKVLQIEKSRIRYLPPGVFDGMTKLQDLKLADGGISQVTEHTFAGLKKLKRLSLFRNSITDLPKNVFKSQGGLEYLDVSYNGFTDLKPHFFPDLRGLLWLNLSHNAVPSISGRTFARNSVLRVLNLNDNALTRLDANSLRGMRFMRRLFFAGNQINRIGRGTFRAVSRIGTIDLARNSLTKVDFQMFADLRFIDTIDLSLNQITEVQRESFKNIFMTRVNLSNNAITELGDGVFQSCENMTLLDLSHNGLRAISEGAFDANSYATHWDLTFNKLTSMTQIPMTTQSGIKVLNASHNELVDVPKGSFPKLFELHTIDFSHNNISSVGRGVFGQLFSLRTLTFRHNSLTDLESSTFGKLPSLLSLDMSHNQLRRVRRGVLAGLTSVRQVWLNNNQLSEIPSPPPSLTHLHLAHNNLTSIGGRRSAWPSMNSLLYLDLNANSLRDSLKAGTFSNLLTVGTLKLRANGITKPPVDALSTMQSLRILNLDDNLLTNLTKWSFGRLPVVAELSLSSNKLNNITINAFEGLLQLQKLDLSRNNLSYVPPGAFQTLVSLRNLDLSFNKLEYLQNRTHGLLEDCLSIRTVNLSHNHIPFVTKKMFPESKWIPYKLEHIDLSHNLMPVLSRDVLVGTKHLKYFNVSYNKLNEIREGVLTNMTSLEILDISGNVLSDKVLLDETKLNVMPNLTEFYLHHNQFYNLPVDILAQQKKLHKLDVSYNFITSYYPKLTMQIKSGLEIFYEGNPLTCDCSLRPIAYWLRSVGRVQGRGSNWDATKCRSPKYLEDTAVGALIEEELICEDSELAQKFKLNPDVMFRELREDGNKLEFSWYVNTNEDVGDFHLELRTRKFPQSTLFQQDIPYETRYQQLDHLPAGKELSLCLLVKNSAGRVRTWRQDQCRKVGPFSRAAEAMKISGLLLTFAALLHFSQGL